MQRRAGRPQCRLTKTAVVRGVRRDRTFKPLAIFGGDHLGGFPDVHVGSVLRRERSSNDVSRRWGGPGRETHDETEDSEDHSDAGCRFEATSGPAAVFGREVQERHTARQCKRRAEGNSRAVGVRQTRRIRRSSNISGTLMLPWGIIRRCRNATPDGSGVRVKTNETVRPTRAVDSRLISDGASDGWSLTAERWCRAVKTVAT